MSNILSCGKCGTLLDFKNKYDVVMCPECRLVNYNPNERGFAYHYNAKTDVYESDRVFNDKLDRYLQAYYIKETQTFYFKVFFKLDKNWCLFDRKTTMTPPNLILLKSKVFGG